MADLSEILQNDQLILYPNLRIAACPPPQAENQREANINGGMKGQDWEGMTGEAVNVLAGKKQNKTQKNPPEHLQ